MLFAQFVSACRTGTVVPLNRQILSDFHTPISLLNRFCYENDGSTVRNGVFLLESVEGGEKWGRYSILGIDPYAFVRIEENDVVVEKTGADAVSMPHHHKPLDTLRELMKQYKIPSGIDVPAGAGTGLVGYFTYEAVSFFENIPHKLKDEPLATFVIPRTVLILDNVKQTLNVCVLTFLDTPPNESQCRELYRSAEAEIARIVKKLAEPLAAPQPEKQGNLEMNPLLPEGTFRKQVETIKEHIRSGDVIQCVISQPFVADNAPNPVALYRALRFANPSPYLFFMSLNGTVLAGSSPETMVRLEGKTATLRPIAGTRKRGETEQRDRELADEMLRDPKERAEHLMLVDLGRNDLGRIAKTGTVQVTDLMFIERYTNVMHLVSNVTAELDSGYDGFDLFEAAFPAGTLTGAPKIRAMQIIAEQEGFPRRAYGGAAGYISFNGNIDFAITIRTAMIRDGKLTAQAGAGVVYDSVPELERKESVNKALGIARALNLLCAE